MKKTLVVLFGGVALAAGCAGTAETVAPAAPGAAAPAAAIVLPASAMPREGECRYWFPKKPEAQPASGSCAVLGENIPFGAWYLRRPAEDPKRVYLTVTNQKGTLMGIHILDAESGKEIKPAK